MRCSRQCCSQRIMVPGRHLQVSFTPAWGPELHAIALFTILKHTICRFKSLVLALHRTVCTTQIMYFNMRTRCGQDSNLHVVLNSTVSIWDYVFQFHHREFFGSWLRIWLLPCRVTLEPYLNTLFTTHTISSMYSMFSLVAARIIHWTHPLWGSTGRVPLFHWVARAFISTTEQNA